MLKKYGILGSGDASDNVIEDALIEIGDDNEFIVGCPPKPSKGIARAIDWLIDNEVKYAIVCTEGAPSRFIDNASHCEYRSADQIEQRVLAMLQKTKGTLLLLWDKDKDSEMEKICFDAADVGVLIRDLSNGLSPLWVESDEQPAQPPAVAERHIPTAEIEVEPFSRDEMLSMSIGVLRKTAKAQGLDVKDTMSKEDLVNAIMYAESINEGEQEEDYLPPIDLGTFHIVSSATNQRAITSSTETCMLTAVFPSGVIMSRPATVYEVKTLFGFESLT